MIVVGVDGSEASDKALRWALAEAKLRGVSVRAVSVYEPVHVPAAAPLAGGAGVFAPSGLEEDVQRLRSASAAAAERVLSDALERMGEAATASIEIETDAVEGSPAEALIDAGRSAELLVLGSRGRGGFVGLLLGSVSQQCAQHAACPVVIVRSAEDVV
jgi:nucleotide-binding universal stress UspA family protein